MSEILQPIKAPGRVAAVRPEISSSVQVKLAEMFRSTDFVRVINIDDEPFEWQALNPADEQHDLDPTSSTVPMRITTRQEPEFFRLDAGKSALLPGRVAYLFIEGLYKKMTAKAAIGSGPDILPGGRARNFSFSDDKRQREFIDQVYLGKELPGIEETPKEEPVVNRVGGNTVNEEVASDKPKAGYAQKARARRAAEIREAKPDSQPLT